MSNYDRTVKDIYRTMIMSTEKTMPRTGSKGPAKGKVNAAAERKPLSVRNVDVAELQIDETFDGVIFTGYHSSTANTRGVRAHTMSSANITSLRLNGIEMTEGSMNAAIAGHFGVPVILVTGDDAAVAENQVIIGDIEGAIVKWSYGFHSARTLTPEAAYEEIRVRTASAISRRRFSRPRVRSLGIRCSDRLIAAFSFLILLSTMLPDCS